MREEVKGLPEVSTLHDEFHDGAAYEFSVTIELRSFDGDWYVYCHNSTGTCEVCGGEARTYFEELKSRSWS
jgi:hypothetical protein